MNLVPSSPQVGRYWVLLAVAALAAAGFMFSANDQFYREYERIFTMAGMPSNVKPAGVLLTIDFGNGKKRAFLGKTSDGLTVYRALATSSEVGKFLIATDQYGHVTAIAGVKAESGHAWNLYVNGSAAAEVPGNIDIKAGDTMVFRYE